MFGFVLFVLFCFVLFFVLFLFCFVLFCFVCVCVLCFVLFCFVCVFFFSDFFFSKKVARQMALMAFDVYSRISSSELLQRRWLMAHKVFFSFSVHFFF